MPKTSKEKKATSAAKAPDVVHQFLIVLTGTDPLVWRRIQVPRTYSFWDLHVAIQDAMGWEDRHLHEFRLLDARDRPISIGVPTDMNDADRPVTPGWKIPLAEIFESRSLPALPVSYAYDFGDDWSHVLVHEAIEPAKASLKYPRCLAGARRCPPEDCGGAHGYQEFLKVIANRKHPEHASMLKWVGGAFDPNDFSPARVAFDDPQKRWTTAFRPSGRG